MLSEHSDFFSRAEGTIPYARWRRYWQVLYLLDAAMSTRAAAARAKARKAALRIPKQSILLAGIEVPGREADISQVVKKIVTTTRHDVTVTTTTMQPIGKLANINFAISAHNLDSYDWLLIIDDDIDVPSDFLDLLIYFSYVRNFKLSQPAHKFLSHKSFLITERQWNSQARNTNFVEVGPVTLLHRDTFADLTPFPTLRWCWGVDVFWAHTAKRRAWNMGIVDAVPIRHLRPVGGSYDMLAAREEATAFLNSQNVSISRAEIFDTNVQTKGKTPVA